MPAFSGVPSALWKNESIANQILSSFRINIVARIAGSCERMPASAASELIASEKYSSISAGFFGAFSKSPIISRLNSEYKTASLSRKWLYSVALET